MATTAAPTHLTVNFTGYHTAIPPLALRVRGDDAADGFRRDIARHASQHMRTGADDLTVNGHPDSPTGTVDVDGGTGENIIAVRFRVEARTPAPSAVPEVPTWVVVLAVIALLWALSQA